MAGFIFLSSFPLKEAWMSSPGLHNIPCPSSCHFGECRQVSAGEPGRPGRHPKNPRAPKPSTRAQEKRAPGWDELCLQSLSPLLVLSLFHASTGASIKHRFGALPAPRFLPSTDSCCAVPEQAPGTAGFKLAPGETSQPVNLPAERVPVEGMLTNQHRGALPARGTRNASDRRGEEGRGFPPCSRFATPRL